MPRKPYQSPRDWLPVEHQRLFGYDKGDQLPWHAPQSDLDAALLTASQRQNDLAYGVRVRIGRAVNMADLASAIDLHVNTVRRILNGTQHANLPVLYALTNQVGLDLAIKATRRVRDAGEQRA